MGFGRFDLLLLVETLLRSFLPLLVRLLERGGEGVRLANRHFDRILNCGVLLHNHEERLLVREIHFDPNGCVVGNVLVRIVENLVVLFETLGQRTPTHHLYSTRSNSKLPFIGFTSFFSSLCSEAESTLPILFNALDDVVVVFY